MIEADDEAAGDLQSRLLDLFDGSHQVALDVVVLAALGQRFLVGRFDADEDHGESCAGHQVQELVVVGEVYRRFGEELERPRFLFLPFDDCRQDFPFQFPAVADEIVVDEEDVSLVAARVNGIEFRDYLLCGFGSDFATEELRDVAELAVIRAAPRVLDIHRIIFVQIDEVPLGHGGSLEVVEAARGVNTRGLIVLEVVEESRQGCFRFIEYEVVDTVEVFVLGGKQWSPGDYLHPLFFAPLYHFPRGIALHYHGADEDDVRPFNLLVLEAADVHVHNFLFPIVGQH